MGTESREPAFICVSTSAPSRESSLSISWTTPVRVAITRSTSGARAGSRLSIARWSLATGWVDGAITAARWSWPSRTMSAITQSAVSAPQQPGRADQRDRLAEALVVEQQPGELRGQLVAAGRLQEQRLVGGVLEGCRGR